MESFATEEEAHADGRYELEKINPSLEVVTGKAWPRAEGKEMIATSHGRQSWKDNPKAKDDCDNFGCVKANMKKLSDNQVGDRLHAALEKIGTCEGETIRGNTALAAARQTLSAVPGKWT